LVEVHVVSGLHFYHFDFYRFNDAEEYLDAGLDEYFSGIFEDNSYFGKHVGLQKIVINQRLDPNNVYYIGDETRDIAASKKAGIKSIAVTWGYAGDIPLSDAKPDYLS